MSYLHSIVVCVCVMLIANFNIYPYTVMEIRKQSSTSSHYDANFDLYFISIYKQQQ